MAIRVPCSNPQCRKVLDCPDEHAGKTVKCPACGMQLKVPLPKGEGGRPQMLGDYQLVRKLGQGGMGAVYEAVQTKLDRKVALKVLAQKLTSDSTFLDRFQREAKAAAALNHPNIVQVYDIGEDRGIHFFAMELVDGESVQDRLKREGKLPLDWSLHIVRSVAEALRFAGEHQIIHRDIKPDNIMLTKGGHVKLADLGLAKKLGGDTVGVTQTGAGMGTPYYMAPEQAEDARSVDHRADIYSLGITLLHLLTGKRPFEGESAYNIIIGHVNKPLPTGEQLGTPLPAAVESVIRKMCAKEPGDRYQDYDSLVADLQKAQQGAGDVVQVAPADKTPAQGPARKAPSSGTPEAREPATVPARRRQKSASKAPLFIGAAAVMALVAAGLFFAMRGGDRADRSSGIPSGASSSVRGARQTPEPARGSGLPAATSAAQAGPTTVRQEPDAGEDAGTAADAAGMLAYAETYAKEHSAEFAKVIERFREVERNCKGTVEAMKAKDAAEVWQKQWEGAAGVEIEKRRASAAEALKAWKFQEAETVWQAFPKHLRTVSIEPKIEAERAHIEEARNGVAKALADDAKPLLSKKAEQLSAEEAGAVSGLLEKAEKAPEGLPEEAAQAIEALAEKLRTHLEAYETVAASEAQEAFDEFWVKYETAIKRKEFDEAVKLCESSLVVHPFRGSPEHEEDPLKRGTTNVELKADAILLKTLFAKAEENLPSLKGKSIRISGMSLRVSEVREGRIYAGEGGASMAFGADRLDPDTLLKLGLAGIEDLKSQVRAKALHAFYFGKSSDAAEALKEAAEAGQEVSFYQSRMVPVLVVTTTPAGAEVRIWAAEVKEDDDAEPIAKGNSPLRIEVEKNATYRVEIAKDGYQPVTEEVKIGLAGEFRASERLKKAQLPAYLIGLFELPKESKDKYGNPVRKGADRKTGMPLEIRHQKTGMHFVFIPAGEFLMGSPDDEKGRHKDGREGPVHKVRLTKPFYLGKYEVTQAEWKVVMGNNPSKFPRDRSPVEMVTWDDCQAFLKKLNEGVRSAPLQGGKEGPAEAGHYKLGLPTEAQWEYACRAGTQTRLYFGDDLDYKELAHYGWFEDNSDAKTHPVGEKKPNAWGLYDMHGNVWEWCEDRDGNYEKEAVSDPTGPERGSARRLRGGGWHGVGTFCRSACRGVHSPGSRTGRYARSLGCRVSLRSYP